MKIETREVLAEAYIGKQRKLKQYLTHAVELDELNNILRVLGGSCVKLENLADVNTLNSLERNIIPTCKRCANKDPRFITFNKE